MKIITNIDRGLSTTDSNIIADIIVPIVPASKHTAFLIKHFDNALGAVTAPKNTPIIKLININTPSPNKIHTTSPIKGINPNANSIATIAPKTTLSTIPANPQALESQFLLQLII